MAGHLRPKPDRLGFRWRAPRRRWRARLAGARDGADLLSDQAVVAVHQGSGGLLRRADHLARGALMAAAREGCAVVSAEHVRLASTEIL